MPLCTVLSSAEGFGFFLLLVFMQDMNLILLAPFELSAAVGMLQ